MDNFNTVWNGPSWVDLWPIFIEILLLYCNCLWCFWVRVFADLWLIFFLIAQDRFLDFSPDQHPIVLQIGGNNLENLAKATKLASTYGYDEINLKCVYNFIRYLLQYCLLDPFIWWKFLCSCGCPSPKVAGHGCFGVRLMLDPKVWTAFRNKVTNLNN